MMTKASFELLLQEQLTQITSPTSQEIKRELEIKVLPRKATIISGIRRSGKSTLLRQHLRSLEVKKKEGTGPPLYLSFFDERLTGLEARQLNEILIAYSALHNGLEPTLILFDEIQEVPGWEKFTARLLEDSKKSIFLTGSSARLLSKEIATAMRGRSLCYELFPFSWTEFLNYFGENLQSRTSSELGKHKKLFQNFLVWGGFPELASAPTPLEKQKILKEYFEVLLFRDLVERNEFSQVATARKILVTFVRMYGSRFTINQTHKKLKAEGISLDKAKLSHFLSWCEDAYILFPIRIWTPSEHKARTNPQKIYLSDLGIAQACETWSDQNLGRRFENACFVKLRSRPDFASLNYYVTNSGYEVDFILENLSGKRFLIQCCWELNEDCREREVRALTEAMKELSLKEGLIVTFIDPEEKITTKTGEIRVLNFSTFFGKP